MALTGVAAGYLVDLPQAQAARQSVEMNALQIANAKETMQRQQTFDDSLAAMQAGGGSPSDAPAGPVPSMGQTPEIGQAEQAAKLSKLAYASGMTDMGAKYATQADNFTNTALRRAELQVKMQGQQMQQQQRSAEMIASGLNGVSDQASYDAARDRMGRQGLSKEEIGQMPAAYDPEFVQGLQEHALSYKDKVAQQQRANDNQQTQDYRKASLDIQRGNLAARVANDRATDARITRTAKVGTPVGAVTTSDQLVAIGAVKQALSLEGDDQADLVNRVAPDVAAQAKAAMKENPGLDLSTASYRVVAGMLASNQLEKAPDKPPMRILGHDIPRTGGVGATEYKPKGQTVDNPLPMPTDNAELIKGRYYIRNGAVQMYNGPKN